jgi:hypothetical protein
VGNEMLLGLMGTVSLMRSHIGTFRLEKAMGVTECLANGKMIARF